MRKIFILTMLLAICSSCLASFIQAQGNWRWRNSDGSETSATWKAAQNTSIILNSNHEVIRLRLDIGTHCIIDGTSDTCNGSVILRDFLQYTTDISLTSLSWKSIGYDIRNPFVIAASDNYVQQDQGTTSQITGSINTFVAGKIMVSDSIIANITLPRKNFRSEFEWVIKSTPNLSPNTTYYFRQFGTTSGAATSVSSYYPSLTTGNTLPVKLTGFIARSEGKKVKIEWSTTSEQNNDRFEIQRSADGLTWETIDKVKGRGSTVTATDYSAYDNNPFSGMNYYRLQQFDQDEKSSFSDIQSIRMTATGLVVSLSPNPTNSVIAFTLQNALVVKVFATLSDASGKIIHRQTFNDVQVNTMNKLSLQHLPAPGVYILKLEGAGLSKSLKVVVQ